MLHFKTDTTWTLFLDRDGVINKRKEGGYITSIKEFVFLPHVLDGLKILSKQFSKIIIVTNQQGVGKGIMDDATLVDIHNFMIEKLESENINIDGIYFATNLRNATNDRRKPSVSMALEAKNDFPEIDFNKSIMVGDTDSDLLFGKSLNMKTVLIKSGEKITEKPDVVVNNLKELANEISH